MQSDALDAQILACIEQRNVPDFNALALEIFAYQIRHNEPYGRYCALFGYEPGGAAPQSWEAIPPVPSSAFKEAALCTFDRADAALAFETSGTTSGRGGMHYMQTSALYDAALLAGFHDAMLGDVTLPLRYLLLVPNPVQRPRSSLGYMMAKVAATYGEGNERWYVDDDTLDVPRFVEDARESARSGAAVCVAGTAFSFVQLIDELRTRGVESLPLPHGSRIMETGGFKGRTRIVQREDLYAQLGALLSVPTQLIVAEYGMTELSSQYYDATFEGIRVKRPPPWMRPRVIAPDGETLPYGIVGALCHYDLANRSSCIAVQTEDLGAAREDGGIILLGREQGAELRGCSLDAEHLRSTVRS